MGKVKHYLIIAVVALVAVYVSRKVKFIADFLWT